MGEKSPSESGGGGGGSRKKRPTAEEMTAIRAPGQRSAAVVAEERRGRPVEPGGNADRAPVKSAPQRAYESIQELRGRQEKQLPGILGGMGRISLDSQIKKLQEGGTPVMSGTMTVGVISRGGSYTGRPEFADLARSSYKTAGAEIRAPIGAKRSQPSGNGDSRATAPATTPSAPTITPVSQAPSMGEDAARRAMMSTAAAGRKRRKLLG